MCELPFKLYKDKSIFLFIHSVIKYLLCISSVKVTMEKGAIRDSNSLCPKYYCPMGKKSKIIHFVCNGVVEEKLYRLM